MPGEGSSPRVRGTPLGGSRAHRPVRFIPACAGNTIRSPARTATCSVHPRVCGEHDPAEASRVVEHGSSPRVRGTLSLRKPVAELHRFIPACAGNTSAASKPGAACSVHPRVCGEHCCLVIWGYSVAGSSPRVRGTLAPEPELEAPERFIPACAGNTRRSTAPLSCRSVHPRVCGEHSNAGENDVSAVGSSPRVRGTPARPMRPPDVARFIPACAGNTRSPPSCSRASTVHPRVCGEHDVGSFEAGHGRGSSPRVRGTLPPRSSPLRRVAVHPRVCGEHLLRRIDPNTLTGSSPRVRGTQAVIDNLQRRQRFIPACAGNTVRVRAWRCSAPVHPRVCGEHPDPGPRARAAAGSSPRVRGTQVSGVALYPPGRFIPACAGNTTVSRWSAVSQPVHPRVCGEHNSTTKINFKTTGSSPRVRGTRRTRRTRPGRWRFIPACAGNTTRFSDGWAAPTVHPRVCGEHRARYGPAWRDIGSSPRVRGTHRAVPPAEIGRRFIPACAGNTYGHSIRQLACTVHPRVCGEHRFSYKQTNGEFGSSPRVRGTRPRSPDPPAGRRFIPACAGNTSAPATSSASRPVHPRVCGEHAACSSIPSYPAGSSPRVRGTREGRGGAEMSRRFIPACAGNTPRFPSPCSARPVHPRVCGEHVWDGHCWKAGTGSSPRVRGTLARSFHRQCPDRFILACAGNTT